MEELAGWDVLLRVLPGSLLKYLSWWWRGTVYGCRAGRRQLWKATQFWEQGWKASALVVCMKGPHSEDTGTWRVSPPPAHQLLNGPMLRSPSLGTAQPVSSLSGQPFVVPRWAALCVLSCFPLLLCFPFLLFPSYSSCFPSRRLFFFLLLVILIPCPYFVVILCISFSLKSGPSRTPVLQLMISKRIFWCINFS